MIRLKKPNIVVVTGVPCTGKTTVAKKLAKALGYEYLDVAKLIKERNISEDYDEERQSDVVDVKKLNKEIKKATKGKLVMVDSHLSHYLPKRLVKACIVAKCNFKVLKQRLEKRGYHNSKVRENLDAEILNICFNEAKEQGHKVLVVDTTKKVRINEVVKLLNYLN
tara:strand:+ start:18 stop:515 length:498 start_codon:yes stop_codon:yes gene_type:complete